MTVFKAHDNEYHKVLYSVKKIVLSENLREFYTTALDLNLICVDIRKSTIDIAPIIKRTYANPNLEFILSPEKPRYEYVDGCLIDRETKTLVHAGRDAVFPSNLLAIWDAACQGLVFDADFRLPEGLKRIGAFAFSGCAFDTLVIPDSVTEIDYCAFAHVSAEKICLPDSLEEISDSMFFDARWLESLYIGANAASLEGGKDTETFLDAKN